MIRPLHHKHQLLALVAERCPTAACRRAMSEGTVIVLGRFTPPEGFTQWIVKISGDVQEWYVAIECDTKLRRYVRRTLEWDSIPWGYWDGRPGYRDPLIEGDCPIQCQIRKDHYHATSESTQQRRSTPQESQVLEPDYRSAIRSGQTRSNHHETDSV